jgi:hypothetical protein
MSSKFGKKFWEWYQFGGKIPRKKKKRFLGYRVSGCKRGL